MTDPVLSYRKVGNIELYNGREWVVGHEHCPYCQIQLSRELPPHHIPFFPILIQARLCRRCGWWYVVQDTDQCNNGFAVVAAGVLERFDIGSSSIPLEVLHTELSRNLHRITSIHPRMMEDLVGSILAGVYDCEVHQVGYTKDGGVDLLLLDGNKQIAVQVKRRESLKKREPVSLVREFLGASLLAGHSNLLFVTNAEAFASGARQAARKAVTKGIVDSYELISRDKLNGLLRKTQPSIWQIALKEAIERRDTPSIPDPYRYIKKGWSIL
jgi:restriction system protein